MKKTRVRSMEVLDMESHSRLLSKDFFQSSMLLRSVYLQCTDGWRREVAVTPAWSGGYEENLPANDLGRRQNGGDHFPVKEGPA